MAHTIRSLKENFFRAIGNDEFFLCFQPRVRLSDRAVVGFEALLRWNHSKFGKLDPLQFMPFIDEASDTAIAIGKWVISRALAQCQEWNAQGLNLKVSINISARHLLHESFVGTLASCLDQNDIPAERVELEILETTSLGNLELVAGVMNKCRKLGVAFALDDFGTGYSSLTYLRRLPIDVVKIDRSFVSNMFMDKADWAIVEAICMLSHTLGRNVVAEGVESPTLYCILLGMQCDEAQGYAISPPIPSGDVGNWLRNYIESTILTAKDAHIGQSSQLHPPVKDGRSE